LAITAQRGDEAVRDGHDRLESRIDPEENLEASVRSRGTDGAKRSERDLIEAGLN